MLDKLADYLLGKWDLITTNATVFLAVCALSASCGYLVARWYYTSLREHIEYLRQKLADAEKESGAKPPDVSAPILEERSIIPLGEAARMAFDATRGTAVAEMAEQEGKSRTEGIMYWYAAALADRIDIFGTWKHAATPSLIDMREKPRPSLGMRKDGKAILWGRGTTEAEDLYVRAADLIKAIEDLKTLGSALK